MTPISIKLLLNYGMISQIWVSNKTKLSNFPYKLKKFCGLNIFPNKSLYIDIDSIPPEWVNKNDYSYKYLPSYHFICLFASSINNSERYYNQTEPTGYKFSVSDIEKFRAHTHNIIQIRKHSLHYLSFLSINSLQLLYLSNYLSVSLSNEFELWISISIKYFQILLLLVLFYLQSTYSILLLFRLFLTISSLLYCLSVLDCGYGLI